MNDSDFDADDETRRLLRAADPARALPSADPARVSALLEETMSQPVNEPKGPARSRLLLIAGAAAAAVVATVVAIGVTGDGDEPGNSGDPIALPTTSTTELQAGPAIVAKCAVPTAEDAASQTLAFEGIVTEIADGTVTLRPTHFYTGEETSRVTIAAPNQAMSEAPAEFVVGESYIVGANDGRVAICGLTGPADDAALRSLYEKAFGTK